MRYSKLAGKGYQILRISLEPSQGTAPPSGASTNSLVILPFDTVYQNDIPGCLLDGSSGQILLPRGRYLCWGTGQGDNINTFNIHMTLVSGSGSETWGWVNTTGEYCTIHATAAGGCWWNGNFDLESEGVVAFEGNVQLAGGDFGKATNWSGVTECHFTSTIIKVG